MQRSHHQMNEKNKKNFTEKIRKDPVYFVKEGFGHDLWEKQRDVILSVMGNKYTTVRSCNGIGKSFIAADVVLWFLCTLKNSIVLTTAPTFRQVEAILWREINNTYSKALWTLGGTILNTSLSISDKWYAAGLSTNNPSRFQGYHASHILIIVDEAAGVDEPIFEAIEGNLSSQYSRLLLIGNPTNLAGTFYSSFKNPNYKQIAISAFDTPNFTTFGIKVEDIRSGNWKNKIVSSLPRPYLITPEWVADKYEKWGEDSPMWQARVMGQFPEQGEDTLIPLHKIEKAAMSDLEPNDNDSEVIGADIARFGADKTELARRKGKRIFEIKEYSGMDTMATSNILSVFSNTYPHAAVVIDDVGIGAGVTDRMRQLNPYKTIIGLNVGLPAKNTEMFANLRAEMYWGLRERFMNEDIAIPDDEDLKSQLANLKFKYTPRGQVQIESKEDMKKRGLSSPDKADAVALSFVDFQSRPSLIDFMKDYSNSA